MPPIISKFAFAASLVSLAAVPALADSDDSGRKIRAQLTGSEEIPVGDPDGSGKFEARINPGQTEICYKTEVKDITLPALVAHIHKGPRGAARPPVFELVAPGASGKVETCVPITRTLAIDLIQNPQDYYVNVHTSDFRPGAVRGQLEKHGGKGSGQTNFRIVTPPSGR